MDELSKIKRSIQNMASKNRASLYTAKVTAVHGDVCNVDIEGLKLSDVKLCAVSDTSEKKLTIVPKVGSYVVVADMSGGNMTQMLIVQYSEVETITINGGELGGLIKIEELVNRMNAIETEFNNLLNACRSVIVTLAPSGEFPIASFFSEVNALDQTTKAQIEDLKIKH